MKKLLTIFLIGTCAFSTFAQKETSHQCSKRNRYSNGTLKSNTLTISQIAQTEKYDVHFYSLNIAMNNLVTTVAGTAEIHASANVPLDSALFELFSSFTISQIRVNGTPVTYSRIASAIKVPVNASTGQAFQIAVDYNGTPPTAVTNPLGGSGMTNASSPSWGNQVTWSLSEPFSAYEWWPCKQSLTDKADSCAIKITVPSNCKAGSNGVLENVVDLGNGTTRYEWKHRHPIDYYLISVAVAKYVEYTVYANPVGAPAPIPIQNFIYDNPATLPNFQTEINETVDFIELFSDLFGLYPFADEKYGHCMAPLSGGMEHQTMTTQGFFEKSLTAHELGHQWWGDNVTCASWADIWVNEGFASYSDFLMIENLYPAEKNQYMLDVHNSVMDQPDGSVYVLDSLNEGRIFSGRLTYDKGSAIVHTMRFMLNNDAQFFQALKNYQIEFKDSVAKGLDVKEAFENVSGLDLTNMFDEWYFGEGYPTYSARWNAIGNDLLIEITHTTSMPAVTPTFTNPIQMRFTRSGLSDTIIRFDITDNLDQFYIPNVGVVTNLATVDPNNWVVNKVGMKIYDPNFILGISSVDANSSVAVYPNPTSDIVKIDLPKQGNNDHLKVMDLNGRLLEKVVLNESTEISLAKYVSGTYLFIIESNGTIIKVERIVKK